MTSETTPKNAEAEAGPSDEAAVDEASAPAKPQLPAPGRTQVVDEAAQEEAAEERAEGGGYN